MFQTTVSKETLKGKWDNATSITDCIGAGEPGVSNEYDKHSQETISGPSISATEQVNIYTSISISVYFKTK